MLATNRFSPWSQKTKKSVSCFVFGDQKADKPWWGKGPWHEWPDYHLLLCSLGECGLLQHQQKRDTSKANWKRFKRLVGDQFPSVEWETIFFVKPAETRRMVTWAGADNHPPRFGWFHRFCFPVHTRKLPRDQTLEPLPVGFGGIASAEMLYHTLPQESTKRWRSGHSCHDPFPHETREVRSHNPAVTATWRTCNTQPIRAA